SPLDLERTFGLIGGDIFHGALSLDQMFSAPPMLGHGDYRGPLKGLYMCGSGTHPGGGVTGAPGPATVPSDHRPTGIRNTVNRSSVSSFPRTGESGKPAPQPVGGVRGTKN